MMLDNTTSFARQDLFGGKGTVEIWDLLGQQKAAPFTAVLWCSLASGGRVGRHQQTADHEMLVCICGRGQATTNETTHALTPGEMVYLPVGATLAIENLSLEDELTYLIVKGAPS
jgi:quercetin dioxygenase-like cupin family protein